ncbi:MAG: hypothetical protein FWB97_04450 [Oscillospiraceae bacterium]|nr:hypothetical protein [Oscillospiraceae bacterium]
MRNFSKAQRAAQAALVLALFLLGALILAACSQNGADDLAYAEAYAYAGASTEDKQEYISAEELERARRWTHDINQFREHILSVHPKFTDASIMHLPTNIEMGRGINERIAALLGEVSALSDLEIKAELQYTMAITRDNHSVFLYFFDADSYPLRFRWLADGFYLIESHERYASALNHRLVAVNGVHWEDLLHKIINFMGPENIYGARALFEMLGISPEVLMALRIYDENGTVITLEDGYGNQRELTPTGAYMRGSRGDLALASVALVDDRIEGELPLFFQNRELPHWHAFLEDSGILYVRFNEYTLDVDVELGRVYVFENAVRDTVGEISACAVVAVVIDARDNPGGAIVHHHLFRFLVDSAPPDMIFYFVNEGSGSASLDAAATLYNWGATIIGQPLGQALEFYFGDGASEIITLDYSGLEVRASNAILSIRERHGIESDDNVFRPHVLIEHTIDDWVNNRDPLLEYVLELLGRD